MNVIHNPILKGFFPDPSIIRVGEDYYIANSTFEWFPGVVLHHSKDLKNWRLIGHALTETSQLNLLGERPSCGVWAPCLSHDNNTFFLVYTDVKNRKGVWKETHNYLVTAKNILGPWSSKPIYLNSTGFDPSLFHDDDGRKWLLNMMWRYEKNKHSFGGILLQQYCTETQKLIGPVYNILERSDEGMIATEGAHLYKRNGYYYLMVAEGGTMYQHCERLFRAKHITGPYEAHPQNPIITARDDEMLAIQKAGHADLVETQNGEWYMVHLGARPLMPEKRCPLGRETSIQKVVWKKDDWLYMENGTNKPDEIVPAPQLPSVEWEMENARDDFDDKILSPHFQTSRIPFNAEIGSLTARQGHLRLYGRESLLSPFVQALIARRWQHFKFEASACVEFEPTHCQQMAGLVCVYDIENFYYLNITNIEGVGKCLNITTCNNMHFDQPLDMPILLDEGQKCFLKVNVHNRKLQFYYSFDEKEWFEIGPVLDASKLSDEYCENGNFTGAFVGICAQDLSGTRKYADFDYFEYRSLE
ncbi:MAG: glycoside hydrolase family 43 protein [Firmicutes bacterium]|nr:glycoside hydrolase family 43 protein [Bacillota bacterium]